MLLIKEINSIKDIAKTASENCEFPKIDSSIDSYYLAYGDSVHQEEAIIEYSSEVIEIKKALSKLWVDSENQKFVKDVLSSVLQTKDDEESVLEAIQLFNYMM